MLIPLLVIGAGAAAAWYFKFKNKSKTLTPKHAAVLQKALENKDPSKLAEAAEVFKSQGYVKEADLLKKRANLRNLPQATKKARRDALKKGLTLKDPTKVRLLADEFEKEGASGSAARLRQYADALTVTS
jgi:hypothetical protein